MKSKTPVAEEGAPVRAPGVGLRQSADDRIALEAEGRRGDVVKPGELFRRLAFGRRTAAAVALDMVHDQEPVADMMQARHRQVGLAGQVVQHEALDRKATVGGVLDDERRPIGELGPKDRRDAPAVKGVKLLRGPPQRRQGAGRRRAHEGQSASAVSRPGMASSINTRVYS